MKYGIHQNAKRRDDARKTVSQRNTAAATGEEIVPLQRMVRELAETWERRLAEKSRPTDNAWTAAWTAAKTVQLRDCCDELRAVIEKLTNGKHNNTAQIQENSDWVAELEAAREMLQRLMNRANEGGNTDIGIPLSRALRGLSQIVDKERGRSAAEKASDGGALTHESKQDANPPLAAPLG